MKLDLIEQAKTELDKKKYAACLDHLNMFFDELKGAEEDHFWGIVKIFEVIEKRYEAEVKAQTTLFDAFILKFERVIITLLDLLVWEVERYKNQSGRHLKVVLVVKPEDSTSWNKVEQRFVRYRSEEIAFKQLRSCFKQYHKNIGDDYKYLFKVKEYIYIGWYCKRDYELLWKLKSISRLQVVHYLDCVKCLDAYMDAFCEALVDLQLNLEKMQGLATSIQEYILRLMSEKKDNKHDWQRAFEDGLDVIFDAIETKVYEQTGKYIFNRGEAFTFDFSWTNLQKCNLKSIKFVDSNFSNANMQGVDLLEAQLINCNLQNVDLSKSNMNKLTLSNTDLTYADLSCSNLYSSNLAYADFSYVNLSNARLGSSDLKGINFNQTILSNTYFRYANLSNADFSKAIFSNSFLSEKDIIGATFSKTIFHVKYKKDLVKIGVNLKDCILVDDNGNTIK